MKNKVKALAVLTLSLLTPAAYSAQAAVNVFSGQGLVATQGVSQASSNGSGASAFFGATQVNSSSSAANIGTAVTRVLPTGVFSQNTNVSATTGQMNSASIGIAASNGSYNSDAIGQSAAFGTFSSLGLGVIVLP